MSKSDRPTEKVSLQRTNTRTQKVDTDLPKRINGFDTETADGQVFMISYAFEGYGAAVKSSKDGPIAPEEMWKVLTNRKARSSVNVWYNLRFDGDVLLRGILTDAEAKELQVTNSVETEEGYDIMYIPSKFLKITDPNGNSYTHYDASQFFYTTLDNAAEEWLGETKANDGIDTKQFGADGDRPNEYILDRWNEIEKYARKDAELVRDLWREFSTFAVELDIPVGSPFSTGYLAQEYMDNRLATRPGVGPSNMNALAWDAYAGGRFEVFERGSVGNVVGADINSAYPNVLSELPDPSTLEWDRKLRPSLDEIRDADYGFVRADVSTNPDKNIQPFRRKVDGVVTFPVFNGQEVTTLKDIFVFAADNGYLTEYDITDCWLGYETEGTQYPFRYMKELYAERKRAEERGEDKKGKLLKIILNSKYGKFCQITPKRRKITEATDLEKHEEIIAAVNLPEELREYTFIESYEAGPYFNPFMASYITGKTRLQLHETVEECGLVDDTVMMATDCLMIKADAFHKSDFPMMDESLPYPDQLGGWDYEYEGDAFVVGTGVYEIEKSDGSLKQKTRGFPERNLEGSLRELARDEKQIEIISNRPRTLMEAAFRSEPLSNVGKFGKESKILKPDFDRKRAWETSPTWSELVDGNERAKPIEAD